MASKSSRKSVRKRVSRAADRSRALTGTYAEALPMERVYHIHRALRDGSLPNCSKLSDELGVTTKTVLRDINFMRDHLGLPVHYDDTKHGFYYKGETSEFPVFELSTEELASLFFARAALDGIRGSKVASELRAAFQSITRPLRGTIAFGWEELDDAFSRKQHGLSEADKDTFGKLAKAVIDRRELEFQYRGAEAERPAKRSVHPLHLGEVDGGWYLIAHDTDRDAIRTFALPRISAVKVLTSKFKRPENFDARQYLASAFGIWADAGESDPVEVRIQFDGRAARVVAERRWHESQEILELNAKGSRIELRMHVRGLREVAGWVLGWGDQAKVLAPQKLADAVREQAKAVAALYKKA